MQATTKKGFLAFLLIFSCLLRPEQTSGFQITFFPDGSEKLSTYEKITKPLAESIATFIGICAFNCFRTKESLQNGFTLSELASFHAQNFAWAILSNKMHTIIHELGHAAAAKLNGFTIEKLYINPFISLLPGIDGYVKIKENWNENPLKKLYIALAGPLAGIGGSMIWYYLNTKYVNFISTETHKRILLTGIIVNIINLMPWHRSDGYHALQAIRELIEKKRSASRY